MRHVSRGALVLLPLAACSPHNPMQPASSERVTPPVAGATVSAAHSRRVLITEGGLPEAAKYQVLGQIDVGRGWYGSAEYADLALAKRARQIGADAVILVKRWHQPSGFSWAAPHGSGQAIKLLNPESFDLNAVAGSWQ